MNWAGVPKPKPNINARPRTCSISRRDTRERSVKLRSMESVLNADVLSLGLLFDKHSGGGKQIHDWVRASDPFRDF